MPRTYPLILICLLASLLAYGATVTLFRAQLQGNHVHLEWNAAPEQAVSGYELYRQDYPTADFTKITSLTPTAQPHYRYLDQNVFRPETGHEAVTYRLAVRTASGTRTYQTTPAEPEENLVLRSWDTIKLMFR